MIDNIKNNTIIEISAKKRLNTLNEIKKNAEIIKYKRRTSGQKELLNLFNNLLDTILSDKTLKSESQEDKNENENGHTLISSKDEIDNENTLRSSNDDDEMIMSSDEDNETMSQNEKVKDLNDLLDEIIYKSKSFEEQIKSLKK